MSLLAPGLVVDRYRVLDRVGAGAMGEVWLAVDDGLARRVALKVLLEHHRENAEVRARFVREARAMAAISHPNVVQVFTTGEVDGRPYLAMEYLDGRDLGTVVKERGPMAGPEAARAALDAARGLQAAAAAGLVHRDVKPSNLVRVGTGAVKVTDFGLAKPSTPGLGPDLTAMGFVVGTPDYIAPEQARGEPIDWRVDVYALGCTIHHLVTGRPPFRREDEGDGPQDCLRIVTRHLKDPPPDPRALAPGVDDELAEVALAMMAKSADERPGYPPVVAALERIAARLERSAARPAPRPAPAASSGPRPRWTDSLPIPARRPSRWMVWTTAVSALVFLAGLGLYLFGPRGAGGAPAAAPDAGAVAAAPPDAAPPPPPRAAAGHAARPRRERAARLLRRPRAGDPPGVRGARPVPPVRGAGGRRAGGPRLVGLRRAGRAGAGRAAAPRRRVGARPGDPGLRPGGDAPLGVGRRRRRARPGPPRRAGERRRRPAPPGRPRRHRVPARRGPAGHRRRGTVTDGGAPYREPTSRPGSSSGGLSGRGPA